jgi:hypothetical protein
LALDAGAARARLWAQGGAPGDLPVVDVSAKPKKQPRDVCFVHEAKIRMPAAAMALIARLARS